MDSVQCGGGEEWLAQCSFGGWGVISGCSIGDTAAGVICQEYEQTDTVIIRLEGSSNSFEGRVEVFHSGAWGTICSNEWGLEEAGVACGQLGFEGAQVAVDADLLFGPDHTGPVYFSGLQCRGSETNLAQCARDEWLDDTCRGHSEAGVVCLSENTPGDGDLRLAGGSTPEAGRLEVYRLGVWGTVCDDHWSEGAATVACRQLGYIGVEFAFDLSDYGRGTGAILLDNIHCTGREDKLAQCQHNSWGQNNCDHSEDVAVTCKTETPTHSAPSENITLTMSTIIWIIIACSVIVSCVLMILRYLQYRQKAGLTAQRNRVMSIDRHTPADVPRFPRGNSGLFIVNGMPIDPNLPPQALEPPDYSSSQWKPPEFPQEPPPSYEATVAHYPDARTEGVSSPVAPDYFETSLPNVVNTSRQSSPQQRHHHGEFAPGYRPTSTPPSSPLPEVD